MACGISPSLRASADADEERLQAWFRTMLASRLSADETPARAEVALTPARWEELVRVNQSINQAINSRTDDDIYGVNERWATPISDGVADPRGDCEDYVLEKRLALLERGWLAETLSVAMGYSPYEGVHVVLIAQTDRGDFMLDNLSAAPVPVEAAAYEWRSRQVGTDLLRWSRAPESAAVVSRE